MNDEPSPDTKKNRPISYGGLEQMRADIDELLRVRRKLTETLGDRSPASFAGFTVLIDAVLPLDSDAQARIARAIRLDERILQELRRREINPADVLSEPLAVLGRALALDWRTFDLLIARDLTWFAEESPLALLRENTADPAAVVEALRAAWERDALDDPVD